MPEPLTPAAGEELVYESDWLASRPFFYNLRSGAASANINDVIDLEHFEFDPEGFNDYLDFGFSVFEHTPVRDVHMLRHSSRLYRGPQGLRVEYLPDVACEWYDRRSTVDEVLEVASAKINAAAGEGEGEVVVPTSGGLDSRLLNLLLHDRSRVRAFTYGVSDDQLRSSEVVKARELARRLGLRWEALPLGDFHRYLDEWDDLYGVSTHAHGMYQMEFYRQIAERVPAGSTVLSGICGDWFSGAVAEWRLDAPVRTVDDVYRVLGLTSALHGDSGMSTFRSERLGAQRLLESGALVTGLSWPRVPAVVRNRIALLSYLLAVPETVGLVPRAPYLDPDVALRMLTLPRDVRHDRRWVRELFATHDAFLEEADLSFDPRNSLNFQAMRRVPLAPLDVGLLREVVRPEYVRWINRTVGPWGYPWEVYWRLGWTPGFRRAVGQLRRHGLHEQRLAAYAAYLTLRPVQELLRRRERLASGGEARTGR